MKTITKAVIKTLLSVVDQGLTRGVGKPIPGQMCVEAAVCYSLGLPHGDDPQCVAPSLRQLKIRLNDSNWSSTEARAAGLRRLAVIQLGSKDVLDEKEFVRRLVDYAIRKSAPMALRAAASIHPEHRHKAALLDAAQRCEKEGTRESAYSAAAAANAAAANADAAGANAAYAAAANAAYATANAAYAYATANAAYAARAAANAAEAAEATAEATDKALSDYAEDVVKILIDMKVQGAKWLYLTET
jgi:hypothetical protein